MFGTGGSEYTASPVPALGFCLHGEPPLSARISCMFGEANTSVSRSKVATSGSAGEVGLKSAARFESLLDQISMFSASIVLRIVLRLRPGVSAPAPLWEGSELEAALRTFGMVDECASR